jgi:hypothetical protein
MSELTELCLTVPQAEELFRSVLWDNVRMISFDANNVVVLLRDNRRVTVATATPSDAYSLLANVKRSGSEALPN